jgi:hypothetical protein
MTPASDGNTLNRRANEALHRLARNAENKAKIAAMFVLPLAVATDEEEEEKEEEEEVDDDEEEREEEEVEDEDDEVEEE